MLVVLISFASLGLANKLDFHQKSNKTLNSSIDYEEVTPQTWRNIALEMRKEGGSVAKIGEVVKTKDGIAS